MFLSKSLQRLLVVTYIMFVCGFAGGKSSWEGYVGAVVAVIFFGSNFVPVKKFETGDGKICT